LLGEIKDLPTLCLVLVHIHSFEHTCSNALPVYMFVWLDF
jgi:hypothetical protein